MAASQLSLVGILWVFCFSLGLTSRPLFESSYFILSEWIRRSYVQSYEDYCILVGYSVGGKVGKFFKNVLTF